MLTRQIPREIPVGVGGSRYFRATLHNGQTLTFRFPSFHAAARLLPKMQGLTEIDNSVDSILGLFDVAGYALGLCWSHPTLDLEAGEAPALDELGEWRGYGERVVDEVQDLGANIQDLVNVVGAVAQQFTDRLQDGARGAEQRDFSEAPAQPKPKGRTKTQRK